MCLHNYDCLLGSLVTPCEGAKLRKRAEKLLKIFEVAGKLSLQLLMQDLTIKAGSFIPDVVDRNFQADAEHIEPHITMQLDANDTSLDGLPIGMCVRPLVTLERHKRNGEHVRTLIATKASVVVFWDKNCKLDSK